MKAIVLRDVTDPHELQVSDVPDPRPGPGEVVVRIRAAALNHRDLYICRGRYAGLRYPIIPGSDGVGSVAALGVRVDGIAEGDEVLINPSLEWGDDPRAQGPRWRILGLPDDGTFAEYVTVPAHSIVARPAGLSDDEAAALPLAGLTAYRAVVTRGAVRPGETVLILGIGGGVATFALLIARQLGARVVVTSGSDEKLEQARILGAEHGLNYRKADWVTGVREVTEGRGADLVIDGTGGETFNTALDAVRAGGRVVTYGATLGPTPDFLVRRVFWKQVDVRGSTMGSPEDFAGLLSLFGDGGLRPVVDRSFPLAETGAALLHMEEAAQFGKIVLRVATTAAGTGKSTAPQREARQGPSQTRQDGRRHTA